MRLALRQKIVFLCYSQQTGISLSTFFNDKNCISFAKRRLILFLEKITLFTSEERIESSVVTVEAKKFLEEETISETLNNASTINDDKSEAEDLIR